MPYASPPFLYISKGARISALKATICRTPPITCLKYLLFISLVNTAYLLDISFDYLGACNTDNLRFFRENWPVEGPSPAEDFAAGDEDVGAGDVFGAVGGKETDEVGDIFRLCNPPQRNLRLKLTQLLRVA